MRSGHGGAAYCAPPGRALSPSRGTSERNEPPRRDYSKSITAPSRSDAAQPPTSSTCHHSPGPVNLVQPYFHPIWSITQRISGCRHRPQSRVHERRCWRRTPRETRCRARTADRRCHKRRAPLRRRRSTPAVRWPTRRAPGITSDAAPAQASGLRAGSGNAVGPADMLVGDPKC